MLLYMGIKKFLLAALSCAAALTVPLSACTESSGLIFTEVYDGIMDHTLNGYSVSGTLSPDEDGVYKIPGTYRGEKVLDVSYVELLGDGEKLVIEYGPTVIGRTAFGGDDDYKDFSANTAAKLTSVALPSSLEVLGRGVFCGGSMQNITLPQGLKSIGSLAFAYSSLNTVFIPDSVTEIDSMAFYRSQLTSAFVFGGEALHDAFLSCKQLEYVYLGENVKILDYAFYGCTALKTVVMRGVEEISVENFYNCTSLESITIPSTAELVSEEAFQGCDSLKEVIFEQQEEWYLCEWVRYPDEYNVISAADFSDSAHNAELLSQRDDITQPLVYRHIPDYIGGE